MAKTVTDGRYPESNQAKGRKNENEARRILNGVYRRPVRVDAYAETDPWYLVDIIALDPNRDPGILFVQVKTNRFDKASREKYRSKFRQFVPPSIPFEVWVRVDYEGWRMFDFDPETEVYECYLEMETCDFWETSDAYRVVNGLEPIHSDRYDRPVPHQFKSREEIDLVPEAGCATLTEFSPDGGAPNQ